MGAQRITEVDVRGRDYSFLTSFRGELLEGIDVEGPELQSWLRDHRTKLAERFLTISEQYFEGMTRFGRCDPNLVGDLGQHILALFEDDETARALVQKAYERSGSPSLLQRARNMTPDTTVASTSVSRTPENHFVSQDFRTAPPKIAFMLPQVLEAGSMDWIYRAFVEDVANALTRFRSFVVLSTQSSFLLSTTGAGHSRELCRDFTVSAYNIPGTPAVPFRLTDERTGRIIWSAEYTLDIDNLPHAFRYLTKHLAGTIAEEIERAQAESLRSSGLDDSYLFFLQGNSLMRMSNLPAVRKARKLYSKARDKSRLWSEPHAKLAQTAQLEWLLLGRNEPELLTDAKNLAQTAIDADPLEATGHWMAAVVALYQRDFEVSDEHFREALVLAPNNAELILQFADGLSHYGDIEKAWQHFELATDLNPLAPDRHWWAGGSIAFARGEYMKATELCQKMTDIEPALRVYTSSLALSGNLSAARASASQLREIYPGLNASEIVSLVPDRDPELTDILEQGLKIAGL